MGGLIDLRNNRESQTAAHIRLLAHLEFASNLQYSMKYAPRVAGNLELAEEEVVEVSTPFC